MNHFYADQPEVSLRFYRRLLQMGVSNAELYNNLGLCCFYAQQYDMSLACMDRALTMATEPDTLGKKWIFEMTKQNYMIEPRMHASIDSGCYFQIFSRGVV